jgi:hypothetical protein
MKYLYVDTPDKLKTMVDHIELQSELAIDLEVYLILCVSNLNLLFSSIILIVHIKVLHV